MTEEQRFAEFLDTERTFWTYLYRINHVKTFSEAMVFMDLWRRKFKHSASQHG